MSIQLTQVCINRAEAIIINANGKAQATGYMASNYHINGVKTIHVLKGAVQLQNGRYVYTFIGEPILSYPKGEPFPIAEFLAKTGWQPE